MLFSVASDQAELSPPVLPNFALQNHLKMEVRNGSKLPDELELWGRQFNSPVALLPDAPGLSWETTINFKLDAHK